MLSLCFYKLWKRLKNYEGRKLLMVHDYMIDKVLDKITEVISNEKFYDTTNLINTDG